MAIASKYILDYQALLNAELANVPASKQQVYEQFVKVGLPSNKDEDWKISPLRAIYQQRLLSKPFVVDSHLLSRLRTSIKQDSLNIVFINGQFSAELSSDLSRYEISILEVPNELSSCTNGFACLQNLLSSTRAVVNIKKNISEPVNLYHCNLSAGIVASDIQINIDKHVTVNLIEHEIVFAEDSTQNDKQSLCLQKIDINCAEKSQVQLTCLDAERNSCARIKTRNINIATACAYKQFDLNMYSDWLKLTTNVHLLGEESFSALNSLTLNNGNQVIENLTRTNHMVPNCQSKQLHKNLCWDNSHTLFDGFIAVNQIAQKTDAQMSNHNLLLSDTAEIYTKPQLEIFADDVACTHGVTSGQLDDDAQFYLRTRGLNKMTATQILINSFAADAVPNWLTNTFLIQAKINTFLKRLVVVK